MAKVCESLGLAVKQRRLLRTSEKELMLLIRLENITKPSLQSLDSTSPQSVYKWRKFKTTATFPRSGQPTKITPKARLVIVREVAKDPRVTSKQLKAFLTSANINVYESIIRRTLSNHGVHGRAARRKPLLSKKKMAC